MIGAWAGGTAPDILPISEWDLSTNAVVRSIPILPASGGGGEYLAIVVDPSDHNYLYITMGPNHLVRINASTGKEVGRLGFSKAPVIRPYLIFRDGNTGYIGTSSSSWVYKLDLGSGQLTGSFKLPFGVGGWGVHQGKFYVGRDGIYALDPSNGSIIEHYPVDVPGIYYVFFADKMAAIDWGS